MYLFDQYFDTMGSKDEEFNYIVDYDFYEDLTLLGSFDGNLFLLDGDMNEIYKFNIQIPLKRVFMINDSEFFLVFEGQKSLYFNRRKLLGWKKDFMNIEIIYYN